MKFVHVATRTRDLDAAVRFYALLGRPFVAQKRAAEAYKVYEQASADMNTLAKSADAADQLLAADVRLVGGASLDPQLLERARHYVFFADQMQLWLAFNALRRSIPLSQEGVRAKVI